MRSWSALSDDGFGVEKFKIGRQIRQAIGEHGIDCLPELRIAPLHSRGHHGSRNRARLRKQQQLAPAYAEQLAGAILVLEDLLRSEGSEVYLKPLSFYCPPNQPVTYEYLLLAAKARGEVALGVQVYEERPENKYGLALNPKVRQQPFLPKPGDRLIVLAEEDG